MRAMTGQSRSRATATRKPGTGLTGAVTRVG